MAQFTATRKGNRVFFGSMIEERFGTSRAIRVGNTVYVSGMTGTDNEFRALAPDLYNQARITYEKINIALQAHGASLRDVVKETIYLKDFSDTDALARAHQEVFGDVRPVSTGIAVNLATPELLIEVDVIAEIGNIEAQ